MAAELVGASDSGGEYELIETIIIEEEGLQVIERNNVNLYAFILAVDCPVANINKDIHCLVYLSSGGSFYTGGSVLNTSNGQSARYWFKKENGIWNATFSSYPPGWGGGYLYGQAKASNVLIANKDAYIKYFKFYTSGEAYFPIGMTIKLLGVRADV